MTTSGTHTTKIVTAGNGGAKSRRYTCSCGDLGPRIAFGPLTGDPRKYTIQRATAKAEATAAEHVATH